MHNKRWLGEKSTDLFLSKYILLKENKNYKYPDPVAIFQISRISG